MIRAFDEIYVDDAMRTLGEMFGYAEGKEQADRLFERFIMSGVAMQFERGNPRYINMPPHALFCEATGEYPEQANVVSEGTPQYWCGTVLAYYQWYMGLRFESIGKRLPPSKIMRLYQAMHETSLREFVEVANNIVLQKGTRLAELRKTANLSQRKLAESSEVSLRSIQLYEQRQLDINLAPAKKLLQISKVLGCFVEDLMEPQVDWRSV